MTEGYFLLPRRLTKVHQQETGVIMDLGQMGYPEQDGADWWQVQEGLEQIERAAWEAEKASRDFLATLERINAAEAAASQGLADALAAVRAALDALPGLVA